MAERNFAFKLSLNTQQFVKGLQESAAALQEKLTKTGKVLNGSIPAANAGTSGTAPALRIPGTPAPVNSGNAAALRLPGTSPAPGLGGLGNLLNGILPPANAKAAITQTGNALTAAFSKLKTSIVAPKSIADVTTAFSSLGSVGVKSLTSLLGPYAAVAAATVTAVMAVKKLCKEYAQLEQAQFKMSRAFRMGGRMQGANAAKFKTMSEEISADGMYSQEDVTRGMAAARQNAPSLSSEQFEKAARMAKDAAAVLGGDYASALQRVTGLLDAETVSYQDLTAAGIVLNYNDAKHLETLQGYYKAEERRKFLMEKMGEAYKDAAKEQSDTLSGSYQQLGNMMTEIKAKIGEVIAPIMKLITLIAKPLMMAIKALLAPIKAVTILIQLVNLLLKPIMYLIGLLSKVGTLIKESITNKVTETLKKWGESFSKVGKKIKEFGSEMKKALKQVAVDSFKKLTGIDLGAVKASVNKMAGKFADYVKKKMGIDLRGMKDSVVKFFSFSKQSDAEAEQKKKEDDYMDPRQKFNVNFEDSGSMDRRIQQSLLEKNSPAVRQVDLLTRIYEVVNQSQGERKRESKEQVSEMKAVTKATKGLNVGFNV